MLNGVADEDGAATASSSSGMVGVVEHEVAESEVGFVGEVGFRDEHDVNMEEGDEGYKMCEFPESSMEDAVGMEWPGTPL
jgi:hypothetical protein